MDDIDPRQYAIHYLEIGVLKTSLDLDSSRLDLDLEISLDLELG